MRKFRTQEKRNEIEENLKKAVKEGVIGYKDYVSITPFVLQHVSDHLKLGLETEASG